MIKNRNEKLSLSGMLIAIGILLPFATAHGIGIPGNILLPMHIPVFICGMLCGPMYGSVCGIILPLLNSVLTRMPAFYPMLPIMVCELFTYGAISGILYAKTPLGKKRMGVYISITGAMVAGRIAYGLAFSAILLFSDTVTAPTVWMAITTGIPGIIVQILLIPGIIFAVEKALMLRKSDVLESAKNLIKQNKATCVIIRNQKIINTETGRGIRPIIALYEQGLLEDSIIVDKIIGRAAAMIAVLGRVNTCYAITISRGALEVLQDNGISVQWDEITEHIINRKGDGICPMEETVENIDSPEEALEALKKKIQILSEQK